VKLVEEYGVRALGLQVDAREADQLDDAVARSVAELGRLDILVANHGVIDFSTVEATSDAPVAHHHRDQPDRRLQGHQGGHPADAATKGSAGSSRPPRWGRATPRQILGTTSPQSGVSSGSSRRPRLEVAGDGITVNALAPGAVETDLFFNQPTYDVFVPDIANPTEEDFRRRLDELDYGLNGVAVSCSPGTSRAPCCTWSPTGADDRAGCWSSAWVRRPAHLLTRAPMR